MLLLNVFPRLLELAKIESRHLFRRRNPASPARAGSFDGWQIVGPLCFDRSEFFYLNNLYWHGVLKPNLVLFKVIFYFGPY